MRAESGTCNVCSAPCTSCLHFNRVLMGSKTEECSDDNCQGNESSQYSVNDTVMITCDSGQRAASETSNLLSVNSNHDSFSENAESKTSLRTCDASGISEDIEMPVNLSYGVTGGSDQLPSKPQYNLDPRPLPNKDEDQKYLEGHEVNISSISPTGGSAVALEKVTSHLQAESDMDKVSISRPAEAVNASEQIGETEKVKESCGLPDVPEASLHSQTMEDSDGSDLVEQDVKVCDICGDAGREDLLAICSRCSDGAEHTYCMREMVDKVPEGDWLCEECKFDDENKSLKQDKSGAVDGNDKNQSSGLASTLSTDLFVKLDKKDSDVEGTKKSKDTLGTKASGKRPAENIEVASAVKRQALDPTLGSPKTSSPSRVPALSRDLSFRNLDKGKVKPAYQLSSGTSSSNNTSETASTPCARPQTPRGTLLKSNSFNYTTAKPKVKLVDEAVAQRKRLGREPASLDMKDGAARSMGKSMSFKSVNPSESKVKMLSPKFSHGQDLKGLKQAKEWNSLDRRNSFKSERSLLSSSTGNATVSTLKGEHKGASYGESPSLPSISNSHEPKGVQTDNKLATLSKPTSHMARRSSEMHGPLGGVKRQPTTTPAAGASLNNGASSSAEQKPNQTNLVESTNLVEKIRGNSAGRSRTSTTTGGKSSPCQKCKEIGHSADFCTVDNPRSLPGDMLATRNLRVGANNGNKLKAAIEAAMLKKPGIYRKNKMSNQSEELPLSSTNINCETRPQEQSSTSVNTRNINPTDEMPEAQVLPGELGKLATLKQLSPLPSEAANLKTGDVGPLDPSDGKPFTRDLGGHTHASAAISALLKISAIPEHEYIWQGGFEVHKSGEHSELRDGIQAHLSTCASPKVLEMVNKFPSRIILNEVTRLSAWPVQFQKIGAKEDNIALYFFAKDLDSYEKNYKSLLDSMMRSDLALQGSFDGVELLVFPSNRLPEKSQRWNMLYFLWGVFRGKKVHCLQDVPDSSRKNNVPTALPSDILSLPESPRPLGIVNGDLPTCSEDCNVALKSECPDSTESPVIVNGDCYTEASYRGTQIESSGANTEGKKDCRFDAASLPRQRTSSPSSLETSCTSTPLEENINHDSEVGKENVDHESKVGKANVDHESKVDIEVQPPVKAVETISGSKKTDKMPIYSDNAPESKHISSFHEIPGRLNSNKAQMTFGGILKEEESSLDTKAVLQSKIMMKDQTVKNLNNWQYDHKKCLLEDSTLSVSQASASARQMSSWNNVNSEDGPASKKQKTDCSELYFCGSSRNTNTNPSKESSTLRIHDFGAMIKEETGEEAKEKEVSINNWTAERYFFPVDPHPVKDYGLGVYRSEDDRLHDGVPNLDLALGADMKKSKQGIWPLGAVDLNDVQTDQSPEEAVTKEDDDVAACLSLSLSFPFQDKEPARPVPKVEQLLPDGQHVNTSLLLFDRMLEK